MTARKRPPAYLAAILLLAPWTCRAESVYRCIRNGYTIYSQVRIGPECQLFDIRNHAPDPGETASRKEALRQWNQEREKMVQESLHPAPQTPRAEKATTPPPAEAPRPILLPGLDFLKQPASNEE